MKPAYIVLEGGEGSGKSTQAEDLARRLDAVLTREPGGTATGTWIRDLLLDPTAVIDNRTEALMMTADRAQHFAEVVLPTLESGRHVVSDRGSHSTLAYQGYGRGLSVDDLRGLCDWAMRGHWPDLVLVLDLPVDIGLQRLAAGPDRVEGAGHDFHERVRAGFIEMAMAEPDRFVVIDATATAAAMSAEIGRSVVERLGIDLRD